MTNEVETFAPRLTFISEAGVKKLLDSACKLIAGTGQKVLHEGVVDILKKAGCPVDGDVVTIPTAMVEAAVKSAPGSIPIYDRNGDLSMDLGGRRAYYGTGSDLTFSLDPGTMNRHQCTIDDVARAARLVDALPNIDFLMSFAHPHEITPKRAYLASFQQMVTNSIKPIVNTADDRGDLSRIWEISTLLRGSEQALRDNPFTIHYAEPKSPLKHPHASLDRLLFCAEKRMPVIYSPAPMSGATGPVTIAGHVVQGLAESLFGLVIHQVQSPGAPFIMGVGPAVFDMKTSQCLYNAPEYLMGFMTMTSGSNLNHDVGYLDFGNTGSLEMVVIMDEVIDQIKRIQQGLIINDEEMALDVIAEVGYDGNFLEHDHTLMNFRKTQWQPDLICRKARHTWEEEGSKTLRERATAKLNHILDNHQPQPLSEKRVNAIDDLVAGFQP